LWFFVRAGVGNFQNIQQIDTTEKGWISTIGVGFKYKGRFQIDYALTDLIKVPLCILTFSVKVDLELKIIFMTQ
jgi:hypothetical protein